MEKLKFRPMNKSRVSSYRSECGEGPVYVLNEELTAPSCTQVSQCGRKTFRLQGHSAGLVLSRGLVT